MTIKMCIRDRLYSFYHNNEGDPLGTTIHAIKDIYSKLPEGVEIVHSCSCLLYTSRCV